MTADRFVDTSYAIALASETDRHHDRAVVWADRIEAAGTGLITTRAVLLEIGNALGKLRFRAMPCVGERRGLSPPSSKARRAGYPRSGSTPPLARPTQPDPCP